MALESLLYQKHPTWISIEEPRFWLSWSQIAENFVKRMRWRKLYKSFHNLLVIRLGWMVNKLIAFRPFGTEKKERWQKMNMNDFSNSWQTLRFHINSNFITPQMFHLQLNHYYIFLVQMQKKWECNSSKAKFIFIQEKFSLSKIVKSFCQAILDLWKVL